MQRGFQVVAISALVAGATLAIRADVTPPTQAAEIQLQLGNLFFSEGRFPESLDAYQHALRTDDTSRLREARSGVIQSALRLAEYDIARVQAEALLKSSPHNAEAVSLYGDSLWASGLFEQAEEKYKHARPRARPPRPRAVAPGTQSGRRRDERGAGGAVAGAARPRDSSHRRRHLRADAQVRRSGRRLQQLREPAAKQGHQRQSRLVARRDWIPALVRPADPVRDGSRCRDDGVHRAVQAGERQDRRARQNQQPGRPGFHRRYRFGKHGHHRHHCTKDRRDTDHVHAQCRCWRSWRGSNRSRSGR